MLHVRVIRGTLQQQTLGRMPGMLQSYEVRLLSAFICQPL